MRTLLAILALPAIAAAIPPRSAFGRETVITQAAGGALREWRRGEAPGILYVRDRTERWYRVMLTGPCRMDRSLDTLTYTTDAVGNFDRFSRVRLLRYPDTVCGVASIRTSPPPPSHRTTKKPPQH